jgi:predicted AlkP superfamily phosphohydrolase/phosphomutase
VSAGAGRTTVVGLDGVSVGLLRTLMADGTMPRLAGIAAGGRLRPMSSSVPEISSVAWTSTMTGVNPGRHGIFGFTDLGPGYRLRFPNLRDVRHTPLWEEWNARGLRTAIVNVPATYPAPEWIGGVLVAGFVALDLAKATTPVALLPTLEAAGYRIDVRSELGHEDMTAFLEDLDRTLDGRQRAWRSLWSREPWDLFFHVITGTDRLLHFLHAAFEDPDHVHHAAFRRYFRRVDACVGEIWDAHRTAGGGAFLMMSDHGFGPLRHEVMTNRVLEELGYFSAEPGVGPGLDGIRPSARAFALDPARIYLHDIRYPRGGVQPEDREVLLRDLSDALAAYEVDGERVVAEILRGDEVYEGPASREGPDLVLVGADGFDFKARLDPGPTVRPSIFTGKHTAHDAFFLAAGDAATGIPWPADVTGVRRALAAVAPTPASALAPSGPATA